MSVQDRASSREDLVEAIVRQCDNERSRRAGRGQTLIALRASLRDDAWTAFRIAVQGASPEQIARQMEVSRRNVANLMRASWNVLRSMREPDYGPLAQSAAALQQTCAQIPAFQRCIAAEELARVRTSGLESMLWGAISRHSSIDGAAVGGAGRRARAPPGSHGRSGQAGDPGAAAPEK